MSSDREGHASARVKAVMISDKKEKETMHIRLFFNDPQGGR